MVASASFAEFPREQLAPLGRVTLRRMFGKTGVFCDGVMLGMVRDNTLYFRVDDEYPRDLQGGRGVSPSTSPSGACRNGFSTSPTSFSPGRAPRWERRVGSPYSGAGNKYSNSLLRDEAPDKVECSPQVADVRHCHP